MKIENMLQRFICISFLFKPPWGNGTYILKNLCLKYILVNESSFGVMGITDYQTKQQIAIDIGKFILHILSSLVSN